MLDSVVGRAMMGCLSRGGGFKSHRSRNLVQDVDQWCLGQPYYNPGHILRKVYNCTERKNFRPPDMLKFPVKKVIIF